MCVGDGGYGRYSSGIPGLQVLDLRKVVVDDVRLRQVMGEIVLMVVLRRIERLQRHDLRDDRTRDTLSPVVSSRHGGPRGALLPGVREEDRRAILRAFVRALPVELVGSCATVKNTFNSVVYGTTEGSNVTCTDSAWPVVPSLTIVVVCGRRIATGIAGDDPCHALHVPEDRIDAPETTAGEHRRLRLRGGGERKRTRRASAHERAKCAPLDPSRCWGRSGCRCHAVVGWYEVREELFFLRREAAEPRRTDLVENAVDFVAVQLVDRLQVDALPVGKLPVRRRRHGELA